MRRAALFGTLLLAACGAAPSPTPRPTPAATPTRARVVNPVTSLDSVLELPRPSAQGLELVFGSALTTGHVRAAANPAGATTFQSCRGPLDLASVRVKGCVGKAGDVDAVVAWANAHNERALAACGGYRFVTARAVTASVHDAAVPDGSATTTPDGQRAIAGALLGTVEYPEGVTIRIEGEPPPRTTRMRRTDERFVVDAKGVLHLARFTAREDQEVRATYCACPTCVDPGPSRPLPATNVLTQTLYAIPDAVAVGPPVAFAPDYAWVNAAPASRCTPCEPPGCVR